MSCDGKLVMFTVPGVAAPGGSKKAFAHPKTGRIIVTDDAKNNAGWKQRVATFAAQAMAGASPLNGPLVMHMVFTVGRPMSHYGTGRNAGQLKPWAERALPTVKPDVTKLVRAAEDAMKGIVWHDDAQVVIQHAEKWYGETANLRVEVGQLS